VDFAYKSRLTPTPVSNVEKNRTRAKKFGSSSGNSFYEISHAIDFFDAIDSAG
jgi:hypothetical protein